MDESPPIVIDPSLLSPEEANAQLNASRAAQRALYAQQDEGVSSAPDRPKGTPLFHQLTYRPLNRNSM